MKLSTAYINHSDCLKHEMGLGHPECPQRLAVIAAQLQVCGLMDQLECHEVSLATITQLACVLSLGEYTIIGTFGGGYVAYWL